MYRIIYMPVYKRIHLIRFIPADILSVGFRLGLVWMGTDILAVRILVGRGCCFLSSVLTGTRVCTRVCAYACARTRVRGIPGLN